MSGLLYAGVGPPYCVRITIEATTEFAPLTVTSTTFVVRKPSGIEVIWAATVREQTIRSLVVEYPIADGDVTELGTWFVWANHTVPGGVVRTEVGSFRVVPPQYSQH